jgi:hypothetical protein
MKRKRKRKRKRKKKRKRRRKRKRERKKRKRKRKSCRMSRMSRAMRKRRTMMTRRTRMMARRTMAETKGSLWLSSMCHHRANKKKILHPLNKSRSCRAFYHPIPETCLKGKQSLKASAIPGTFN